MWPMAMDMMMGKLDGIRDIIRVAYNTEGENRNRLFETARSLLAELADQMKQETPAMEDDE